MFWEGLRTGGDGVVQRLIGQRVLKYMVAVLCRRIIHCRKSAKSGASLESQLKPNLTAPCFGLLLRKARVHRYTVCMDTLLFLTVFGTCQEKFIYRQADSRYSTIMSLRQWGLKYLLRTP
jgi:hypothetical protein